MPCSLRSSCTRLVRSMRPSPLSCSLNMVTHSANECVLRAAGPQSNANERPSDGQAIVDVV
eukprot:2904943-Prymnesium_polylepis.1